MLVLRRSALPSLLVAAFAANATAQKGCDIDEGSPNQVARAMLDLQIVQSASKPQDAAKALREAVKLLNEGDKTKNAVGRSMVYGKVLVQWMAQPGINNGMASRGTLGFATDTAAQFDLIAGVDSAFSVVEASGPECAAQTAPWRQQKGWVDLVNAAMEMGNATGKSDTAAVLAKRSLQLFRGAPYGYMVLAKAAADKQQNKEAIDYYKQAINIAAKDTSVAMADNRRQLLMVLGNYAADLYEGADAADKARYLSEAKAAYEGLAKDPGTKFADAARSGQARLAQMSGDTTAIKATYADQLANPGAFSYASLMNAAVTAARASQTKDAIKLFEAAQGMNGYHRDVLYNLARLYLLDSAYTKGVPIARQLIAVDPSNPDNYQLLQIGYAAIQKDYQAKARAAEAKAKTFGDRANAKGATAAVLKASIDSAAKMTPIIKAFQDSAARAVDSALKYTDVMTKLPAKVSFNEFTPTEAKTTIGGSLTNQTEAARSFSLKIEFVDKTGNVVSTQQVEVGPVQPKSSATFQATGTGAGIVAFRYSPIT